MFSKAFNMMYITFFLHKINCSDGSEKDNGFGKGYVWAGSLESGLTIAKHHNKPIMVIIHKSWCSSCRNLKPKFASSLEIQNLSKNFVMINLMDDDEPEGYAPDGAYIPRILFLSPSGSLLKNIYNESGSQQHKYYYSRPEQIAVSMQRVLKEGVRYKK